MLIQNIFKANFLVLKLTLTQIKIITIQFQKSIHKSVKIFLKSF